VFAQREADEARMRTERMMKQREHEPLDRFRMIKKFSTVLRRAYTPQQRSKLPKHANEATCVLPLFAIAAAGRMGEKSPQFSAEPDQNRPVPPI
jgi:hypothetical protein